MRPYIPPEIIREVYKQAHPGVQMKMRRAVPAQVRNLPRPEPDYTKGTGRYQKLWTEFPKKFETLIASSPVLSGRALIMRRIASLMRNLKREYKAGSLSARTIPAEYGEAWLILTGGATSMPATRNGIMDLVLLGAQKTYAAAVEHEKMLARNFGEYDVTTNTGAAGRSRRETKTRRGTRWARAADQGRAGRARAAATRRRAQRAAAAQSAAAAAAQSAVAAAALSPATERGVQGGAWVNRWLEGREAPSRLSDREILRRTSSARRRG